MEEVGDGGGQAGALEGGRIAIFAKHLTGSSDAMIEGEKRNSMGVYVRVCCSTAVDFGR